MPVPAEKKGDTKKSNGGIGKKVRLDSGLFFCACGLIHKLSASIIRRARKDSDFPDNKLPDNESTRSRQFIEQSSRRIQIKLLWINNEVLEMKKILKVALIVLFAGPVQAVPVAELIITGGEFTVNNMETHRSSITPGAFASMSVNDGYDGSFVYWNYEEIGVAPREADYLPYTIAAFEFSYFGPFGVFTSATDYNNPNITYPGVTGDLTATALTLDLSSWTAFWDNQVFNQGSSNVVALVDANGNFTASWDAPIEYSAFAPAVGNWTITGHVSAVPVPAAFWMFAGGMLCLFTASTRRN